MHSATSQRATAAASLLAVLAATVVTLAVGYAVKEPCASGDWHDGRQYKRLCYSDIVPLYSTEHLQANRLPYLNACPPDAGTCDEYPVLTMYFVRAAAWISRPLSGSFAAFFGVNSVLLAAAALFVSWALYRIVGLRALYFALAPTLAIYGFMNWDLLAVVLATVGTLMFLQRRDPGSGALIGLGAAAKAFPALLLVPFIIGRVRERAGRGAGALAAWAAGVWLLVNLPFALAAPHAWSTFFRFNSARGADWDSLWFVACQRLPSSAACGWSSGTLNVLSLVLFAVVAAIVWWAKRLRNREFPAWTFGFPILVVFLLTNKVYSPQYGLWLLPWFALALPSLPLFVAFEAADIAVFVTRFTWFGRLAAESGSPEFAGYHGATIGGFETAIVFRAIVLVACLVAWVLRDAKPIGLGRVTSFGQPTVSSSMESLA